ncbi:MAG: ATP-binding protein [Ferruginibacter sp.]
MQKSYNNTVNEYMKLKDAPIQRKLMTVILLCCAVVVLLICTAYVIFEYYAFKRSLQNQVSTLAAVTASHSAGAVIFDSQKDANEILSALTADKRIVAASLYTNDSILFAKYPVTIADDKLPARTGPIGFHFANGFLEGFVPVLQQDHVVGALYIKSNMEAMYMQLNRYVELALWLFCFSLFVAYLLSRILRKSISQPILALEQTARMISEKRDYSVRAVKVGKDEVGALTDAFNNMLTRIEVQNAEITSFNIKLEQKVRERTNELEFANNFLKQQNDFVETIIDASAHIIAVLDTDLRFSSLNKKGEELYHVKKENVLGKSYLELFPAAKDSPAYFDILKAAKGEYVHNTVARSAIIDGYFENYFIPLKLEEKVYGVLILSHDITDIMDANEKLKELNIELEKSNRDLEQFAFIASHDLQEPLRKIHIFNDMLGENFHDEQNMRKYQAKIDQSAKRMQELIMDVLNFSRISKSEEAFTQNDLNVIIENLKTDFELLINEKEAVINHEPLPVIPGIALQLSQLFSNLISNSLKYNDKKPLIQITTKNLTPIEIKSNKKLHNGTSYVQIKFTDNGIGFETKYSEQIFTIFQRLHGKQAYSGTGIGLALCRKIVENHHGVITAEGEVGVGATFTIILPLST